MAFTGKRSSDHWVSSEKTSDIFYMKGVVKTLMERLGITDMKYSRTKNDIFSEGISLHLDKTKIVEFGVVSGFNT